MSLIIYFYLFRDSEHPGALIVMGEGLYGQGQYLCHFRHLCPLRHLCHFVVNTI